MNWTIVAFIVIPTLAYIAGIFHATIAAVKRKGTFSTTKGRLDTIDTRIMAIHQCQERDHKRVIKELKDIQCKQNDLERKIK